jgi:hypothetical protein
MIDEQFQLFARIIVFENNKQRGVGNDNSNCRQSQSHINGLLAKIRGSQSV